MIDALNYSFKFWRKNFISYQNLQCNSEHIRTYILPRTCYKCGKTQHFLIQSRLVITRPIIMQIRI